MAGVGPDLSTRMCSRQRIDTHVQDVGDFREALFPFNAVSDRHLFRPEVLAYQWRERP